MRAIRFHEYGGPEVLKLEEVPEPKVRPGMVLVRVRAAGLNYADVMQRRGRYLEPTPLPATAGAEIAGSVVAVGEGVTKPRVGTRVMGFARGGYAEYVVTLPQLLFPIPEDMDFVHAAALPLQGLTAYHCLMTAGHIKTGCSVLVHAAAGGVGLFAVQLAKHIGNCVVIGTASTPAKLELAQSKGLDIPIDYTKEDFVAKVKAVTDGQGVDVILEAVGGEIFHRSLEALAPFGRLVVYGRASGSSNDIDAWQLVRKNQAVVGFYLPGLLSQPALAKESMRELTEWVWDRQIEIVVGHTYPLEKAADAQAALEGRATVGKVVLTVGEG
ncbi:MAG: NADPH:quinone oxidoreductase family protein [Chloroflexi bacterium]|nr:NADPH:quinone oxidoreductase family protein [Chloroflexota bacterium]